MADEELFVRTMDRLLEADRTGDVGPMLTRQAKIELYRLLRTAAPSPTEPVHLGYVQLACGSYWVRAMAGQSNPEAEVEALTALALRNYLRHRLPDPSVLPPLPMEIREIDVDQVTLVAGFAGLIGGACGALAQEEEEQGLRSDALASLDQGIAWLLEALNPLPPDHDLFADDAFLAVVLRMQRYELAADPDSLAGAAVIAGTVFRHVSVNHPRHGMNLPFMLDVVVQSALFLNEPSPREALQLARVCDIKPSPLTANRLKLLEVLGQPVDTMYEREIYVVTSLYAEALIGNDLPALACVAVRMASLLATIPEGHPQRAAILAALRGSYGRLGWDESSLPEPPDDLASRIDAATQRFGLLQSGARSSARGTEADSLLDELLTLGEALAVSRGLPGLPPEVRAAIAFADCAVLPGDGPAAPSLDRIIRYRTALEGLPSGHPARPVYTVIAAAYVQESAAALREQAPNETRELETWARSVVAELERSSPPGFKTVLHSLSAGSSTEAKVRAICELPESWSSQAERVLEAVASASLTAVAEVLRDAGRVVREQFGDELLALESVMNVVQRIGGGEDLEADVRDFSDFMNRMRSDDELSEQVLAIGAELINARISRRKTGTVSNETLIQIVDLLQRVHDASDQPSVPVAGRLTTTLTELGLRTNDPARHIEAEVVDADLDRVARSASGQDAVGAYRSALGRLVRGLILYISTHDPDQLERAKQAIPGLLDLAGRADAEQGPESQEFRGIAVYLGDFLDVVGPGSGPKPDISDEVVERCRQTYASTSDPANRGLAALNLYAALISRAGAIRAVDPERADQLLAEALKVTTAVDGLGDDPVTLRLKQLFALQRARHGEPIERPDLMQRPSMPGVENSPMQPLLDTLVNAARYIGSEDKVADLRSSVEILRNPGMPAWLRVQMGIIAAQEAALLDPSALALSLVYGDEAITLLEKLTDRGASPQAAEHALVAFDGAIRKIASLMFMSAMAPSLATKIEEFERRIEALKQLVEHAARGGGKASNEQADEIMEAVVSIVGTYRQIPTSVGPQVDELVALHEHGRGLLLTRRLESRTDLSLLRAAHPELADRFELLTGQLETGSDVPAGRARLEGLRASRELDELIDLIKSKPGFEGFLARLSASQLRELAAQGPVVVLNHAEGMPCVAFIVTAKEIVAVHLFAVTAQEVTDSAQRLGRAIEAIYAQGDGRLQPSGVITAREEITTILDWTWHRIVGPILERIGCIEPIGPGTDWPRVWWIPTGPFNALPLQAAQCKSPGCAEGLSHGSALDCVVSSFIPDFQTLAHTRAARKTSVSDTTSALVVSEIDGVLPGAVSAARFSADVLGADKLLIGPDAALATVRSALETSAVVQIGCHAHSSPDRPAGSWVQLPTGEALSVPDICRIRPHAARLAVLTACGTARSAERLSDEAVHVTSAFLLAGYPEAVGTLWEVDSMQIEAFLREFYPRVLNSSASTAYAVHKAIRELRGRIPDKPYVWGAYIHAGG